MNDGLRDLMENARSALDAFSYEVPNADIRLYDALNDLWLYLAEED